MKFGRRSAETVDIRAKRGPDAPRRHGGIPWRALSLYASVGLGSILGGTLRWLASTFIQDHLGSGLPWGTLFVNVVGSFVIGFYAALTGPDGRLSAGSLQRQFVTAGLCGGFTTFSMFSLETVQLVQNGDPHRAAFNVAVSVAGWMIAVWAGYVLATRLNRPGASRPKG
jgi:CrcB protein